MLQLGMSPANYRRPAGGGGGAAPPASATRFWGPQDMTFNGSGELTAVTDRISSGYVGITGAPTGDVSSGITMTKAGAAANYITLGPDFWWSSGIGVRTLNVTMLYKPTLSGFAGAQVFVNTASSLIYVRARDAASFAIQQNMAYSTMRVNGSVVTPSNQNEFWDLAFADTNWSTISLLGFSHASANAGTIVRYFSDLSGENFQFDGKIGGLGVVSDPSEVGDMEAALLASVA